MNTNSAISSTFTKKIEHGDSKRSWDSVIITSDLERTFLPTSVTQGEPTLTVLLYLSPFTDVEQRARDSSAS